MTLGTIYKLTSPNGKVYIGQTINVKHRLGKYKRNYFKGQTKLWNSCQASNWNPIDSFEIVEECEVSKLDEREQYWIAFYDSFRTGLNCDAGGKGRRGFKMSDEHKQKLREANLGKTHTTETRQKIGESSKGRTLSSETKLKIGQKNSRPMSDEQKLKLREAILGTKRGPYKNGCSDETKSKISQTKKGVPSKNRQRVICLTNGIIYDSMHDAAQKLKLNQGKISLVCNNKLSHTKQYRFEFYEQEKNCHI